MDDEPVLRALSADLERDDPGLAAFLSGRSRSPHRHSAAWLLLLIPALAAPLVIAPIVTLAVTAMILGAAAPLAVCWWCGLPDDFPPYGQL